MPWGSRVGQDFSMGWTGQLGKLGFQSGRDATPGQVVSLGVPQVLQGGGHGTSKRG